MTPFSAMRRRQPTPWRAPHPQPGPVVVFDIDGVLADMRAYEHLIEGPYSRTRWNRFHRHFADAKPIQRNLNLLHSLQEAGMLIAYSTTRPESAAQATWDWLETHGLPQAPMLTRHAILDGQRVSEDVKLRHWFYWIDNRANLNPIVGWVEDEEYARDVLVEHGCPAWDPERLRRLLARNKPLPAMRILTERTAPSPATLAENYTANADDWRRREEAWEKVQRKAWVNRKRRRESNPPQ